LKICLLGEFQVWRAGELVTDHEWKRKSAKTLLQILLTEPGQPFLKEQLYEWLWPEEPEETSREKLHQSVTCLRRILEPHLKEPSKSRFILTTPTGYLFRPTADCYLDITDFLEKIKQGDQCQQRGQFRQAIDAYRAAEELYMGDFLEEARYEDWAASPRERFRQAYLDLFSELAVCLARQGRRYEAQKAYQKHCRLLSEERGQAVEAMPEAQELAERIQKALKSHMRPASTPQRSELPFVGREPQLQRLLKALESAARGRGQIVLLAGEAGIGKSRLLREFVAAREALSSSSERNMRIIQATCSASHRASPYESLWDAAKTSVFEECSTLELREALGVYAPTLGALWPELRELLGLEPGTEPTPQSEQHPKQEQLRQREGLCRFFRAGALEALLIFLLDDLQWVDASTLQFLEHLVQCPTHQKILIVGAYRSEELGAKHPLRSLEQALERKGLLTTIALESLGENEVLQLVEALKLSSSPKERRQLARRLYQETDGSPFYLDELIRALREEGLLCVDAQGRLAAKARPWPAPKTVREMILTRYDRLRPAQRKLLDAAAVVGLEFEAPLLAAVCHRQEERVVRDLDELCAVNLLAVQERYGFSHDVIHEVLYEALTPGRRRWLHQLVGETMERLYHERLEGIATQLAHHFHQAQAWPKALQYLIQAGERAGKIYAVQEALSFFDRALELAEQMRAQGYAEPLLREQVYRVLAARQELWRHLGRPQERRGELEQMFELARKLRDERKLAECFQSRASQHYSEDRYELARDDALQGLELARRVGDRHHEAICLNILAYTSHMEGAFGQAVEYLELALAADQALGDCEGEVTVLGALGVMCSFHSEFAKALAYLERARALNRELGDPKREGIPLVCSAMVYLGLGQWECAIELFEEAHRLFLRAQARHRQIRALVFLGVAHRGAGHLDQARRYLNRSQRLARQIHDRAWEGYVMLQQGVVDLLSGEARRALVALERALAIFEPMQATIHLIETYKEKSRAHLALSQPAEALACSRRALELVKPLPEGSPNPGVHLYHAQALRASGLEAEAREHLLRAYEQLRQQFANIPDPVLKESFLKNVGVNRQIVAEWEKLRAS